MFALIGLGLGLTSGRDGKLASFVPGIGVVFVYYVIDYQGRQMAKGQLVPPWLATWGPNIVLGIGGVALLLWRSRSAERPFRLSLPARWRLRAGVPRAAPPSRRPRRAGSWSSSGCPTSHSGAAAEAARLVRLEPLR